VNSFNPASLELYLVADPDFARTDIVAGVEASVGEGVTCVQLRWKTGTDNQIVQLARALQQICESRLVPLIINDRVDIALAVGAAGVHLGVDDLALKDARRIGGPAMIIGYSPESDADIAMAADAGANYLGIGPLFSTTTKSDAGEGLGPHEFGRRRALTTLPVVAIGGLNARNVMEPMRAGADGVAVVSAVLGQSDPRGATRLLRAALDHHR
jgi:thiamine-phosphate diphosphorylase